MPTRASCDYRRTETATFTTSVSRVLLDNYLLKRKPHGMKCRGTRERNQCCCRCHYQRNFPRSCPVNSKSPSCGFSQTSGVAEVSVNCERRLALLNDLTAVTERTARCSDSCRGYTSSRNRLKRENSRLDNTKNKKQSGDLRSLYSDWRTRVNRRRLWRIMCQSFVVVVLCLCGGVLMYNHHGGSKGNQQIHKLPFAGYFPDDEDTESSGTTEIVKDLPFRAVPLDVLEKHIEKAETATDVLKLFFDKPDLSDEAVNSIMWMKSHQHIHGSEVSRAQRNYEVMNDVESSEEEYREKALLHAKEFAWSSLSSCRDPVPELERVEDPQRDVIKHYWPRCTVLHRCRNTTGCCPRGFTCGPRKENGIKIVEKSFFVFKQSPQHSVVPDINGFIETRNFINHTACECHRIESNSNCHMHCPHQFTKEQSGDDCVCTCKPNNRKCRHIFRGLTPLDEKDLECIKTGKCLLPECHAGEFKIQTGFCPQFHHHSHHKEA